MWSPLALLEIYMLVENIESLSYILFLFVKYLSEMNLNGNMDSK